MALAAKTPTSVRALLGFVSDIKGCFSSFLTAVRVPGSEDAAWNVAANINVGDTVHQGDVIAFVGDSGTPESISNPDTEEHLHFELRAGDGYLGQGLPPDEVRALYERLFTPVDAP